ncbi:MAG: RNA-binding cell elongation regulator Jag/EloR [Lysinibacillus sp.]
MKQITQIGSSVEEAIQLALQKLGTTRDQVDVEVLQEGKKGFLGFGARPFEVRVTEKEQVIVPQQAAIAVEEVVEEPAVENGEITEQVTLQEPTQEQQQEQEIDPIDEAKAYLTDIAQGMGIEDLSINHTVEGKYVLFTLESEKAAYLIGKRGQTLNALQQLTQLVLNKSSKSFLLARLDVENYRERREQALEILADRMADKAVRTGKKVKLEPMLSSERKIIHNQLANRIDIETYSEGVEPNRYLVIEPLK